MSARLRRLWHDRAMLGRILATYRQAFAGLPRHVWLLSAVTLIHRSGTMVLPFLTLYLTTQRGMSVRMAGFYLALYGVGGVAGAMAGGRMAERWGNHRAMQLTLAAAGLGFLALGVARDPRVIAPLLFATSVAAEGFRTPSSAALGLAVPPSLRARAFAHRRLAINLGMAIGTAAGGLLATMAYLWLFVVDGSTCLAAALAVTLWLVPREREAYAPSREHAAADPEPSEPEPSGPEPSEPESSGPESSKPESSKPDSPGRSLWSDSVFVAVLALSMLMNLAFAQLYGTYPLTMSLDFGYSEAVVGALMALNTVIIVLFEMVLIHRLEHLRPLGVVAAGCLIHAVGFVLVPWGQSIVLAVVAMTVLTVGEMLIHPVVEGFVANHVPVTSMNRAMGLLTASFAVTVILAPVVGTFAYDLWGHTVLWLIAAGICGVTAVGFLWLAARTRQASKSPTSPLV